MIGSAPPSEASEGVLEGGGFRRQTCPACGSNVVLVAVEGGGEVLVDGKSETGAWRAVRVGDGWRLTGTAGAGVRYAEHRCLEAAAALLGAEVVTSAGSSRLEARGAATSGPCVRRCGEIVPNRYGPNAVVVCDECRDRPR